MWLLFWTICIPSLLNFWGPHCFVHDSSISTGLHLGFSSRGVGGRNSLLHIPWEATLDCTFMGYHNLGGSGGAPKFFFFILSILRSLLAWLDQKLNRHSLWISCLAWFLQSPEDQAFHNLKAKLHYVYILYTTVYIISKVSRGERFSKGGKMPLPSPPKYIQAQFLLHTHMHTHTLTHSHTHTLVVLNTDTWRLFGLVQCCAMS